MVVLCSLGSKNAKGTSAEPGCHGYTKWRGEKYGARLPTWQQDRAIERLNELVSGGMDAAVLRPSEQGQDHWEVAQGEYDAEDDGWDQVEVDDALRLA